MGVHGAFLDSLKRMYARVTMHVCMDGELGASFPADVGVKQGDQLSPLLFGLFINRFETFVAARCSRAGAKALAGQLLQALLYAEDLTLIAESAAEMQELLDCLRDFAVANHMAVNVSKSVIVVFNDNTWQANSRSGCHYDGKPLRGERDFRFLGMRFFSACNKFGNIHHNMASNLAKCRP